MGAEMTQGREVVCWVADVGSVRGGRFGWCRSTGPEDHKTGSDIEAFAAGIAEDVRSGMKVALGFECPLFVPVTVEADNLTSARKGEHNRSWSAGPGCAVLATGLVEVAWVFMELKTRVGSTLRPTLAWTELHEGDCNLFLWEAFVSGTAKGGDDKEDAAVAAESFWAAYPGVNEASSVTAENPLSLVGAALLWSGLSSNRSLLGASCVVIKS